MGSASQLRSQTMNKTITSEEISSLIEPDRVHRRVYTDPEIFKLEMQRIWGRAWVFIAHESMLPNPGDFITTTIGLEPVIAVRDIKTNDINVLLNRCGHRGVKLEVRDYGNQKSFRCPYHGWAYRTNGELAGVPHSVGYKNTNFDVKKSCYQLKFIPRVATYRGFVFASLAETGPDLETFLGDTRNTIDNMADRSPVGRVEVVGKVCNRFVQPANWKNFIENLNDAMHPMVAHAATGDATNKYAATLDPEQPRPAEAQVIQPFGGSYQFFDDMGQTVLPYGHNYMGGHTSIFSHYDWPEEYLDAMFNAKGEDQTRRVLEFNRHNTTIYPSIAVRDGVQSIRVVRPVAVDETVLETWVFRLVDAPEQLLSRTLLYSQLINSPGSMVGPDDLDCYKRMQLGLASEQNDWVDFNRYLNDDKEEQGRTVSSGTSDLAFRNQYKAWSDYMTDSEG